MDEVHRVESSTVDKATGGHRCQAFRLQPSKIGIRIETPTVITRTEWTRKQATALRDALTALLADTSGGAR